MLNREQLAKQGVHVAFSRTSRDGNHAFPWTIKGWDVGILDESYVPLPLDIMISQLLFDAQSRTCDQILLSSEDFSLLTIAEWNFFFEAFHKQAPRSNVIISMVYTTRNIDEMARGMYSTLVELGLNKPFAEVQQNLELHFQAKFQEIADFVESLDYPIRLLHVPYSESNYLKSWFNTVLPSDALHPLDLLEIKLNVGRDEAATESQRRANENKGINFDTSRLLEWPSFHNVESIRRQRSPNSGA